MGIDIIFKIAGVGIITAVINQILKKSEKDEIATLVTLASLVIVLSMVVSMIGELLDTVKTLFSLQARPDAGDGSPASAESEPCSQSSA